MNGKTIIEIHPYDFAELISAPLTIEQINSLKTLGDETFEFDGKTYHRSPKTPRTPGEHFID